MENKNVDKDVLPPLPVDPKAPPAPVAKKPIQVKAIAPGYYDHRRIEPGMKFNIKSAQEFSYNWMEDLSGTLPKTDPKLAAKKKAKADKE